MFNCIILQVSGKNDYTENMDNFGKIKIKPLLITGLFLVIIISIWVANKSLLRESPIKLTLRSMVTPTPLWQNYDGSKYNFSLSYPSAWNIQTWDLEEAANLTNPPDGSIMFQLKGSGKEGKFEVLVWRNNYQLTPRNWVANFLHEEINRSVLPNEDNFDLNGNKAVKVYQFSKARKVGVDYVFTGQGKMIYELIFERPEISTTVTVSQAPISTNPVYEEILNSFSLIVKPTE